MVVVAAIGGYLIGSIPFSLFVAQRAAGVDLREYGAGTVSGSWVGKVAGFWPMALAGVLDIAKGAGAVLLFVGDDAASVVAAIAVVVGHNWSPVLRFGGGRGVAPALGATAVVAWPGTVVLSLGLALGKLAGVTALGSFLAQGALPVVLALTHGGRGAMLGAGLTAAMWAKRIAGDSPPGTAGVVTRRLLRDRDSRPS